MATDPQAGLATEGAAPDPSDAPDDTVPATAAPPGEPDTDAAAMTAGAAETSDGPEPTVDAGEVAAPAAEPSVESPPQAEADVASEAPEGETSELASEEAAEPSVESPAQAEGEVASDAPEGDGPEAASDAPEGETTERAPEPVVPNYGDRPAITAPKDIGDVPNDLSEEDFAAVIARTVFEFKEGDIVAGTVVRVDPDEALVDIGYKTEGVIPAGELSISNTASPDQVVSVGDEVEALVLQKEDENGRLLLSKKRAQAVVSFMVDKGLNPDRVTAKGNGETNPTASNKTDDGRAQNRRTDILFISGVQ